jgi:hypothetical protein
MANATLSLRRAELERRVEALPVEVKEWQARTRGEVDLELHFSQLNAIGTLMDGFVAKQRTLLAGLDPEGNTDHFQSTAFELVKQIIRSQRVWDFFRDKLDLRFSPAFKDALWVADTVAWSCYRPVLEAASRAGILASTALREPPLTYLTAEFSPATWFRGSRPNDGRDYHLGTSLLPIPVIELPWDHMQNSWEFMALHHEVGHDLEADLKLREALQDSLQTKLAAAVIPQERIDLWKAWQGEVFSDLVGLQLGGAAFGQALMHLLLLPAADVTTFDPEDPHPTHYLRILLNADYIPTLIPGFAPLVQDGQQLADRWLAIYGVLPGFDNLRSDFPHVYGALMDTALAVLQNKTVREMMPYKQADDVRIRAGAEYFRTGLNRPGKDLEPRHCISSARLAVTQAAVDGTATKELLETINKRTLELVRTNAPDGVRGSDSSTPHKEFIASFVDTIDI